MIRSNFYSHRVETLDPRVLLSASLPLSLSDSPGHDLANHADDDVPAIVVNASLVDASLTHLASATSINPSVVYTGQAEHVWVNEEGWTEFAPSSDTRVIYVSSSTGNDNNDGLTPETALETVDKGKAMMRDNHPDWLLFKRGDRFDGLGSFTGFSGRSDQEMMLVSTYGQGDRPVFDSGVAHNITASGQDTTEHIAFVGLSLVATGRVQDTDSGASGVRFTGNVDNVLLEDLEVTGFKDGMVFQKLHDSITDISVRRSQVHHNFSSGGHSQGMFAKDVNGLFVEENLFDHNGWNEELGIEPTKFNHGLYIQHGTDGFELIGNIISRNSSHGVQARNGGVIENNLIVDNAVGAFIYSDSDESALQKVINNVVIDASMRTLDDGHSRGWGYDIGRTNDGTTVFGNLAIHSDDTVSRAIAPGLKTNLSKGIIVYGWEGVPDSPIVANAPDVDRTIASYHEAVGRTGSFDVFINEVIGQSKGRWTEAYTADAVNDYIRAGFGLNGEPDIEVLPDDGGRPTTPNVPGGNGGGNGNGNNDSDGHGGDHNDRDENSAGSIRFEAEDATLVGNIVETKWGGSNGAVITNTSDTLEATASVIFEGTPGTYRLSVGYFDENDGVATYSIAVDGVVIDTWLADQVLGMDAPDALTAVERAIEVEVELVEGSEIVISTTRDELEYGRVDYVDVTPVVPPMPDRPTNGWEDNTLRVGVDAFELTDYEIQTHWTQSADLLDGTSSDVITLKWRASTGIASYTFTGVDGQYDLGVGYYDENDGQNSYTITVNGQTIDTWVADAELGSDKPDANTFQHRMAALELDLQTGDVIAIVGEVDQGEYARVGFLELTEVIPEAVVPESQFSADDDYGDALDYTNVQANRWTVVEDQGDRRLLLDATHYNSLSGDRLGEYAIMDQQLHDDFRISVSARSNEDLKTNHAADYAVVFGFVNEYNYSYMMFNSQQNYTQLFNVVNGQRELVATATEAGITDNAYHDIVIERVGSSLTVSLDGQSILTTDQADVIRTGYVGLGSFNDSVYFDDLYVDQPQANPIMPELPVIPDVLADLINDDLVLDLTPVLL